MKKYKHISGEIATEIPENGPLARYKVNHGHISASFVENTLDWKEIKDKEYEILSFLVNKKYNKLLIGEIVNKNKDGGFKGKGLDSNKTDIVIQNENALLSSDHWSIYSVKRLSDNEIFTIGDKVVFNKNHEFIIGKFYMDCNKHHLLCSNNNGTGHVNITKISKVQSPLFITEDGVAIFEFKNFFFVKIKASYSLEKEWVVSTPFPCAFVYEPELEVYFSTEEKAEEYILMNKPCLSINDLKNTFDMFGNRGNNEVILKGLVRTKL